MSNNINNKKALAEKLKNHLNSPEYVAVPDLIKRSDYTSDLSCYDGENIQQRRKFIEWEKQPGLISYNDLEPSDWEEITNLIKKRNEEREQNYQAKKKKIEEKVNSQPGLYYYYGSGSKEDRSNSTLNYGDKKGEYFGLWGSENGRGFYLKINSKHSVLDTFLWGKHGYYLIKTDKPIERNNGVVRPWSDYGKNNPSNFHKWVEVGDKITITPYEVENDNELSENQKEELKQKGVVNCDICQRNINNSTERVFNIRNHHGKLNGKIIHACSDCYKNKEQEYLQNYEFIFSFSAKDLTHEGVPFLLETIKGGKTDCYAGKKDRNGKILQQQNCPHCQPWKQHSTSNSNPSQADINSLVQYFQQHSIKKIKLVNGELIITHNNNNNNNNKTLTIKEVDDDQELQLVRDMVKKSNKQELTKEELEKMINNNSNSSSNAPNSNKLWIGIGGGLILIIGIMIGWIARKKGKNK